MARKKPKLELLALYGAIKTTVYVIRKYAQSAVDRANTEEEEVTYLCLISNSPYVDKKYRKIIFR